MILGITGHRPQYWGYSADLDLKLFHIVRAHLERIKPDKVVSGMALGMDQTCAKVCVMLGIPFIAAIPFRGQEKLWKPKLQEDYFELLRKASEIVVVSEGEYSVESMLKRNEYVVSQSHEMLVLHNGSRKSGTSHAVGLAVARGLPVLNIWKEFSSRTGTRD